MTSAPCRPNFFIVGAPKSGTTSLHRYLAQHPDVFMSARKEPCFLAPDFSCSAYPQTEDEYLRYFVAHEGQPRIGESTTMYLYSKLAARTIREFSPDARIIAMLRNPIDMVASLHAQRLKTGSEDIKDFEDALEAEADRRQGKRIPGGFKYPEEYLLYREYGRYARQLERYYRAFGRENVHVIVFDDFRQNPEEEYGKVCEFLGIAPNIKPEFAIHNPARTPRFLTLHRAFVRLRFIEQAVARCLRAIIPFQVRRLLRRFYGTLWTLNMKTGRVPMLATTRIALAAYYEQEIKDLEILLERNLDCWRSKNSEQ